MTARTVAFLILALVISLTLGFSSQWALSVHGAANAAGPVSTALVVLGPALAAAIMVRRSGRSIRQWIVDDVRATRPRWWWIAIPPSSLALTLVAFRLAGADSAELMDAIANPGLALSYAFSILVVGLLEESGWRGWLLREWLMRTTPLAATAITAAAWAAWHLPKLLSGPEMAAAMLAAVAVQAIILTALWARLQGRVALAAIAHGSFNAPILWFEQRVTPDIALQGFAIAIGFYGLFAVGLVASDWRWWVRSSAESAPGLVTRAKP